MAFTDEYYDAIDSDGNRRQQICPAEHFVSKTMNKPLFLAQKDSTAIPIKITSVMKETNSERVFYDDARDGIKSSGMAKIDSIYLSEKDANEQPQNRLAQECRRLAEIHADHYERHPFDESKPGPTAHLIREI